MKSKTTRTTRTTHKLGANRKEIAVKPVVHEANFKQSRDIREDRGTRQMKTAVQSGVAHGK